MNKDFNQRDKLPPGKFIAPIIGFNIDDLGKFNLAIKLLKESLNPAVRETIFVGDNLVTWNRNLSFIRDPFYSNLFYDENLCATEKSIIWRTYILLYFAEQALTIDGHYLELGCYRGTTAESLLKKCDLNKYEKKYYLYDIFEWEEGSENHELPEHKNSKMYDNVVKRFSGYENVYVVPGHVPDSFENAFPNEIAFAHMDMNQASAEAKALDLILPRLSKHGYIIFDDYGWWAYSSQKKALDPIAEKYGTSILELPTGQGLLIKN